MDMQSFHFIALVVMVILTSFFTCRFLIMFLGLESKRKYYFIYLLINLISMYVSLKRESTISIYFGLLKSILIVFLFCRFILKTENKTSFMMSCFITSIWASLNTFTFSLSSILFRVTILNEIVIISLLSIIQIIILAVTYHIFVKRYGIEGKYNGVYMIIFIVPISFISLALHTIMDALYTTVSINEGRIVGNSSLQQDVDNLILSLVAISCIYVILYTYEKVMVQIEAKNNTIRLETENLLQRRYIFEAKNKYDSTNAFRHDFKNHIITINGLLNKNEISKAKEYMGRFEEISESINFDVCTNNTIIDILLGEKLALANTMKICVACDVKIEEKIQIDDFDLCTVFSNALDNAIKACIDVSDTNKFIDIIAKRKKDFFVIDIINSFNPEKYIKGDGIGLETIRLLTEKYGGTMEQEEKNSVFRLSILFTLN